MTETIDFVMKGKIDGAEITPATINFTRFNEFNQQVEDFIAGGDHGSGRKLLLDTVFVQVLPGSYCLRVGMSIALLYNMESELGKLTRDGGLSRLDEKRAKIVEKWQSKAKSHDDLKFEIRIARSDGTEKVPAIHIGPDSNFQRIASNEWVSMETYLLGEIYDIGGENPNVHIRLSESSETHIVQTDKDTLRRLEKNLLYQRGLLHVTGEQDRQTGRLQKLRLLEFVNYNPNYDQEALDRFISDGRTAWADVPDASAWVRELRGG